MSERLMHDAKRVAKAILTNQLARFAPGMYMRITGETGRGLAEESSAQASGYFRACFDDYFTRLGIASSEITPYLSGKRVLEYGPGDLPVVALLMIAHGAEVVFCVDRFPLMQLTEKNLAVIDDILSGLDPVKRERADSCFLRDKDPASGFNPERICYRISPSGLSGLREEIDLVLSRAVLEHVNDLPATFADMHTAMKQDATAIHQVDLKSHGLHQTNPLDFLTWPDRLWRLMYSHKGVPNRLRINTYRDIIAQTGFNVIFIEPTLLADPADVQSVRPDLAQSFRQVSDEDMRWLGFWLACNKKVN